MPNDFAFVSTGSTFPRGRIPKTFPRHRICPDVETFGATLEGNVLRRWPRGNVLNVSTWRNSAYAHSGARMTGVDDPRGNVSGAVQTFPRGGFHGVSNVSTGSFCAPVETFLARPPSKRLSTIAQNRTAKRFHGGAFFSTWKRFVKSSPVTASVGKCQNVSTWSHIPSCRGTPAKRLQECGDVETFARTHARRK